MRRRLSISFSEWPEREQRFWREEVLATDGMITGPRGAILAERTKQTLQWGFEQWVSFLFRTGRYRADLSIRDHFSPESANAFIEEILLRKRPISARIDVSRVAACFRIAYGRDKVPWVREVVHRLRALEARNPPRIKLLKTSSELLRLGLDTMAAARAHAGRRSRAALSFRDGLMIALLAARPIRLGNLSAMKVGTHLIVEDGLYWIHFSDVETKTGLPIHLPLPRLLTPYVREYLQKARPVLLRLGKSHDYLWGSVRGTPLAYTAVYRAVTTKTLAAFGGRISPHRFRHAAATSQALCDPTRVMDSHKLLGHATFKVTQRFYIHTSTDDGIRELQKTVLKLRRSAGSMARPTKGRMRSTSHSR